MQSVLHVWEWNNYMGNISWIRWTGASAKRLQKCRGSWESDWMNHLFITFGPARNFVLLESCSLRCHIGGGRANASQNIHPNFLLFSFTRSYIGSLLPVLFLVFLWNIDGQWQFLYILKPWGSSWFTWLQCICKSKDNIFLFLAGINRCNFFLFFFFANF